LRAVKISRAFSGSLGQFASSRSAALMSAGSLLALALASCSSRRVRRAAVALGRSFRAAFASVAACAASLRASCSFGSAVIFFSRSPIFCSVLP
jgi:hypothetical protein